MRTKLRQRTVSSFAALLVSLSGSSQASVEDRQSPLPAATSSVRFTVTQLEEMRARVESANAIVANLQQQADTAGIPGWRMNLYSSLYNTPSAALREIASTAHTLDQAHALADAAYLAHRRTTSQPKALIDAADDLTFTPKTPCRFIDTRNVGGVIATTRNFDEELSGSSYGGDSSCTLPGHGEIASAVNVTVVVGAGDAGYLGIRPFGSSALTSFLNWPVGGTPGIANAGIITAASNPSAGNDYQFQAFVGGGNAAQVVMDYFGYFAPAAATALDCVNTADNFTTIAATDPNGLAVPDDCPATYTTVSVQCYTQGFSNVFFNGVVNSSTYGLTCQFTNNRSTNVSLRSSRTCCRVP